MALLNIFDKLWKLISINNNFIEQDKRVWLGNSFIGELIHKDK